MSIDASDSRINEHLDRRDDLFFHEHFPPFEQMYLLTYMQLADTKASVFLAMTTSAIAYMVAHFGLGWLKLANVSLHLMLLSASAMFLGISAAYAFAVLIPRLADPEMSIIYFRSISRRISQKRYVDDVLARSSREILQEQLAYCYDLSRVCTRKYRLLDRSLMMGVPGYAAFLAALILL